MNPIHVSCLWGQANLGLLQAGKFHLDLEILKVILWELSRDIYFLVTDSQSLFRIYDPPMSLF